MIQSPPLKAVVVIAEGMIARFGEEAPVQAAQCIDEAAADRDRSVHWQRVSQAIALLQD